MNKKLQERDLRQHFEAILGHEIGDIFDEGVLALRERTAVWSIYDNGQLTSREIGTTGDSTKGCGNVRLLYIGGLTVTGADGKADFLLSDYHCIPPGEPGSVFYSPIPPEIFVATAQSQDPIIVTTRTFQVQGDVRIEIYTWEPGGAPAKGKLVKWFGQIPLTEGHG